MPQPPRAPLLPRLAAALAPLIPSLLVCLGVLLSPNLPPLHGTATPTAVGDAPAPPASARRHRVRPLHAATAAELQERLSRVWEGAEGVVPATAPSRLPVDLDQLPVPDRKEVFFRSLLPHVLDHNNRIAEERKRLQELQGRSGAGLSDAEQRFLDELAERYRVAAEVTDPTDRVRVLLEKVDVVPPSLALAQAAIESAWGTSRFTRLGNNLFGQWVFHRDRGIPPLERPEDANYSLARFAGLGDAVDAYLRNLNGFYAYQEFRHLRRQMRAAGEPLDPYRLAAGLHRYSTRGGEYVRDVLSVIRGNRLTRYDRARLAVTAATTTRL